MRAVVQRCNWCKITLENGEVSETGKGLVVLLGVGKEDNDNDVNYIADKVMNMRVFLSLLLGVEFNSFIVIFLLERLPLYRNSLYMVI